MDGSLELVITTFGNLASSTMLAVLTAFVFLNNPKKLENRLFALSAFFITLFGIFFAIAINLNPSPLAYAVWMYSIIDVGMVVFFYHLAFVMVGKEKESKVFIWAGYGVGAAIVILALIFPHFFLESPTPKLFTKSYPNAGPIFTAMFAYFNVILITMFVTLIREYKNLDTHRRGQVEYFFLTVFTGFGFGSTGFALVYNLPVSPLFTLFFGIALLPLAYGIVAKEMLNIRIVFKRALVYSAMIGLITGFFVVLISINDYLASHVSWIKWWTTPIITATVGVFIGRLYWKKSIENERLKYEFITVAAHKLRTPLTQISWSVRGLLEGAQTPETREAAERIQHATSRLIELTNIIFETTTSSDSDLAYVPKQVDLAAMTREVYAPLKSLAESRGVRVDLRFNDGPVYAKADERRVRSVIEVLLENAIHYTKSGGLVSVFVSTKDHMVTYAVRDTGIGIAPKDRKLIFSRFYRSDEAKRADTEGVGLGLAMAKNIIEKHGGKMGAESEGEGKGATFWFSLPQG